MGGLVAGMIAQVSAGSEFAMQVDTEQRQMLARGIFDAFYFRERDKDVIFDTNRMWTAKLGTLLTLYPHAKIIACVRNVAWVVDSIERLYRANPFENTKLFGGNMSRTTVQSRAEGLTQHDQLVGFAWAALREAYYGEHAKSLLVLDYELLAKMPHKAIPIIYQFIGEPLFDHDYAHVQYDAHEFDSQLGVPGLHRVRSKVAFETRRSVLPPDLFDKYSKMSFWEDTAGSAAHVIAAVPPKDTANAPK